MSTPAPTPTAERLFFALWPDEATRARCAEVTREIGGRGGKRTPVENLHITLSFLGALDARRRACAEQAADAVHAQAFTLTLERIGYFPRPRVLWIGTEKFPLELATLVRDLNRGLAACGIELDRRPFAAHMTFMRKVSAAPAHADIAPVDWPVRSFSLIKSDTLPQGAVYTILRTWALRATAAST